MTDAHLRGMNSVIATLWQAYAVIADPSRWCRHSLARDRTGKRIWHLSEQATQWCALGAILRSCATDFDHYASCLRALDSVNVSAIDLVRANDLLGHAATCALLEHALRRLEALELAPRNGRPPLEAVSYCLTSSP